MKYVTRRLLKNRPDSEYIHWVDKRPHQDSVPHRCSENAMAECRRQREVGREVAIAAGWLVYPRDEDGNTTVCFHIWNYDPEQRLYYDVSPPIFHDGEVCDYVLDHEVWTVPLARQQQLGHMRFPDGMRYDQDGWIRIAVGQLIDEKSHWVEITYLQGVRDRGQALPLLGLLLPHDRPETFDDYVKRQRVV